MSKRLTTKEWVQKAISVHGNTYDYSKTEYIKSNQDVCIICPKHGEFWQRANNHVTKKYGCPKCKGEKNSQRCKYTKEQFIEKSKQIHGNKYDYSKVNYIDSETPVIIICPEHGEFPQIPSNHYKHGSGCPECGKIQAGKQRRIGKENLIKRFREVHGNKYDYSKMSEDVIMNGDITIICPIHGEFKQTPANHLHSGCLKCGWELTHSKQRIPIEEFISRCKEIHPEYDYSITEYKGLNSNIKYICPVHGIVEQNARDHLHNKSGCPKCSKSHGEKEIEIYLKENNIKYIDQYEITIDLSINPSGYAYIDFFLPELNIAIEYNGIQHYKYVPYLHKGDILNFNRQQNRDDYIRNYCKNNNIRLIEIKYTDTLDERNNKLKTILLES